MTPRSEFARALAALALACALGCRESSSSGSAPAPVSTPPACTSVGQRCEVSPGKLGSCVVVDDCDRDNCFVCQSQH